jgi:ABC-type Fe3+-hydroxamate transport system substrate-binding protein
MALAVARPEGDGFSRRQDVRRTTMKKLLVTLTIAAAVVTGACASMGSRSISEVKTNPGKFADKTVTVEGVVTTSFGIPLVPFKVYRISDGTSEMLVISDNSRIPGKDARVRVRGEVEEVALIGGRSFGLHIREKSIKFL